MPSPPSPSDCYATAADMVYRFDKRVIGDLLSDDDTRVVEADFAQNATLHAALTDATQMINAAIRVGGNYTYTELYNLYTDGQAGTTRSKYAWSLLTRLCCNLALANLKARRGYSQSEIMSQIPFYRETLDFLEMLRKGERILDLDDNMDAGKPTTQAQISSSINYLSQASRRLYGNSANQTNWGE